MVVMQGSCRELAGGVDSSSGLNSDCYDSFQTIVGEPSEKLSKSFVFNVPHVRQSFNWDCGLACVLMVLRAFGAWRQDLSALRSLCPTTSVWTVDLAHLLRQFGLAVTFLTVTLGANPGFATEKFYMETMQEDEHRVTRLFEEATTAGINIHKRSLSSREFKRLILSGRYIMIALVDKQKLSVSTTAADLADLALQQCYGIDLTYTGHYVVVCGYYSDSDQYVVKDPATNSETVTVPGATLEAARKAFGTDEDVLLIPLPRDYCTPFQAHNQQYMPVVTLTT